MITKAIWKYPLNGFINEIKMPFAAEILCVQMQHGQPMLWVLVVVDGDERATRIIEVFATGQLFRQANRKYIGTFQEGVFVFHVFERFL